MPNIALQRFMVFNSGEGQGEGCEGDKLIFHWTKDCDNPSRTKQINDICLCDACINVSDKLGENFDDPDPHDLQKRKRKSLILTFEHAVIVVIQVEADQSIWMAAKVVVEQPDDTNLMRPNNSSSTIPAEAVKRVISNIYARFRLLKGSFRMIIDDIRPDSQDDKIIIRDKLRSLCKEYFVAVLKSIHLNSILSNDTALYNSITYIDLNPLTTLKVISFTNHLVCMSATKIRHTLVIFNDQLLWSSLTLFDTRLLFNYLISDVIKLAVQEELSKEVDKVRRIKENYFTIYLTESNLEKSSSTYTDGSTVPEMTSDEEMIEEPELNKYFMTVFRSSNLTLCLILDESNLADSIENTLTGALASLARHVGQDYIEAMRKQKQNKTKRPN